LDISTIADCLAKSGTVIAWLSLGVSVVAIILPWLEKIRELRAGQASKISSWVEDASPDACHIIVANNSDLPIYGVAIIVTRGPWFYTDKIPSDVPGTFDKASEAICELIPPGKFRVFMPGGDFGCCSYYPATRISFVCANSTSWVRETNGSLRQIHQDPFEYFDMSIPGPFARIEPC
jgi:hypothetical protein